MRCFVTFGILLSSIASTATDQSSFEMPKLKAGIIQSNVNGDGATNSECFVLRQNGQWYLEYRIQKQGDRGNRLSAYQANLGADQAMNLVRIVQGVKLKLTPDYAPPKHPFSTRTFELFQATIVLDGNQYNPGYIYFPRGDSGQSGSDPSSEQLLMWVKARSSLLPLVKWIDELGWRSMKPTEVRPNACLE